MPSVRPSPTPHPSSTPSSANRDHQARRAARSARRVHAAASWRCARRARHEVGVQLGLRPATAPRRVSSRRSSGRTCPARRPLRRAHRARGATGSLTRRGCAASSTPRATPSSTRYAISASPTARGGERSPPSSRPFEPAQLAGRAHQILLGSRCFIAMQGEAQHQIGPVSMRRCLCAACSAASPREPVSIRHELLEAQNPLTSGSRRTTSSGWGMAVYEPPDGAEPAVI